MEKIVLLADNQMIVRKGLGTLLKSNLGVKIIGEAGSCSEVMSNLRQKKYSHLITEASLSDGTTSSILPILKNLYPNLHIMVFSNLPEKMLKSPLLTFGVYHFLSKNCSEDRALKYLERFLDDVIPIRSLETIEKSSRSSALAPREFEVYSCLILKKTTNEIAKELNIKKNTVSTIKHKIFKKYNVENWEQLKALSNFKPLGVKPIEEQLLRSHSTLHSVPSLHPLHRRLHELENGLT